MTVVNLQAVRDYVTAGLLKGRPEANGPWQRAVRQFLCEQASEDNPLYPLPSMLQRCQQAAVSLDQLHCQFTALIQLVSDALNRERPATDEAARRLWENLGAGGRNALLWAALFGAIVMQGTVREYLNAEGNADAEADGRPEGSTGD